MGVGSPLCDGSPQAPRAHVGNRPARSAVYERVTTSIRDGTVPGILHFLDRLRGRAGRNTFRAGRHGRRRQRHRCDRLRRRRCGCDDGARDDVPATTSPTSRPTLSPNIRPKVKPIERPVEQMRHAIVVSIDGLRPGPDAARRHALPARALSRGSYSHVGADDAELDHAPVARQHDDRRHPPAARRGVEPRVRDGRAALPARCRRCSRRPSGTATRPPSRPANRSSRCSTGPACSTGGPSRRSTNVETADVIGPAVPDHPGAQAGRDAGALPVGGQRRSPIGWASPEQMKAIAGRRRGGRATAAALDEAGLTGSTFVIITRRPRWRGEEPRPRRPAEPAHPLDRGGAPASASTST